MQQNVLSVLWYRCLDLAIYTDLIQFKRNSNFFFYTFRPTLFHALSRLFTRTLFCLRELSTQTPTTPLPLPTKNQILGFKKDRSRIKEIFPLPYVVFQLSSNNTKKLICLKSKTRHYCQSLVQTGSIPSKICNLFFNYTKILHWNFFLPWRHGL